MALDKPTTTTTTSTTTTSTTTMVHIINNTTTTTNNNNNNTTTTPPPTTATTTTTTTNTTAATRAPIGSALCLGLPLQQQHPLGASQEHTRAQQKAHRPTTVHNKRQAQAIDC
jgi:hypothetical protein